MYAKALVLALTLAAGCVTPAADPASPPSSDTSQAAPAFRLEAADCAEAGAYVTWNAVPDDPDLPPGFDTRHVAGDLGDPPFTTVGGGPTVLRTPADALPGPNVTGAYHPIMRCAAWSLDGVEKTDLWMAWVAAFVYPPTYDPAPLERTYGVGAIGVSDPDLADAFARAGIEAEAITVTDFSIDSTNMRHAFAFSHHGAIYADVPMREAGEKPAGTTRYWAVAPEPGAASRPVALDVADAGGAHLVASAPGAFEHTVDGPAPPSVVPAHTFTSWALAYTGFARTITLGPVVNVTVDADGHVH